jgi:hypothetical protein
MRRSNAPASEPARSGTRPSPPSSTRRCVLQVLLRGALARTQSLTARIYEAWRGGQFVLLVSDPILAELDAVTARTWCESSFVVDRGPTSRPRAIGPAPCSGISKLYMDHVLQAEHGCDVDFSRRVPAS